MPKKPPSKDDLLGTLLIQHGLTLAEAQELYAAMKKFESLMEKIDFGKNSSAIFVAPFPEMEIEKTPVDFSVYLINGKTKKSRLKGRWTSTGMRNPPRPAPR
jgi:hypothetical protein